MLESSEHSWNTRSSPWWGETVWVGVWLSCVVREGSKDGSCLYSLRWLLKFIYPEGNAESLNVCKQKNDLINLCFTKIQSQGDQLWDHRSDEARGKCPCLEDPVWWQVTRDRLSPSNAPHKLWSTCLEHVTSFGYLIHTWLELPSFMTISSCQVWTLQPTTFNSFSVHSSQTFYFFLSGKLWGFFMHETRECMNDLVQTSSKILTLDKEQITKC